MSEYRERVAKEPWRKWYDAAHWKRLRTLVLARDPICKKCNRYPSTVADHIKPHKGLWELFVALENLMGLCKPCHDIKTATEDGGFGRTPARDKQPTCTSVGADAINAALANIAEIAALDV